MEKRSGRIACAAASPAPAGWQHGTGIEYVRDLFQDGERGAMELDIWQCHLCGKRIAGVIRGYCTPCANCENFCFDCASSVAEAGGSEGSSAREQIADLRSRAAKVQGLAIFSLLGSVALRSERHEVLK